MDDKTNEGWRRTNPEPQERLTYSVPEAARKLGIGINSAYAAAKSGAIPTVRIGDRVLVPRAALTAMLAKTGA